jgi:hypothetical protein
MIRRYSVALLLTSATIAMQPEQQESTELRVLDLAFACAEDSMLRLVSKAAPTILGFWLTCYALDIRTSAWGGKPQEPLTVGNDNSWSRPNAAALCEIPLCETLPTARRLCESVARREAHYAETKDAKLQSLPRLNTATGEAVVCRLYRMWAKARELHLTIQAVSGVTPEQARIGPYTSAQLPSYGKIRKLRQSQRNAAMEDLGAHLDQLQVGCREACRQLEEREVDQFMRTFTS